MYCWLLTFKDFAKVEGATGAAAGKQRQHWDQQHHQHLHPHDHLQSGALHLVKR